MLRRLFNFAAAASLLACVATAVLWVRSYWRTDGFSFWTASGLLELRTRHGKLVLDNEPQRALDRQPIDQVFNRVNSINATIEGLSRQLSEAASAWQRSPDRFNKGGAGGAAVRVAHLRTKLDEPERQLFAMQQLSFRWARNVAISPPVSHSVPLYVPLIAAVFLPGIWLFSAQLNSRRIRHRFRAKRCLACGYNLTGNISGVCPECGTTISTLVEAIK